MTGNRASNESTHSLRTFWSMVMSSISEISKERDSDELFFMISFESVSRSRALVFSRQSNLMEETYNWLKSNVNKD